jgi:uncharacterized membrane protein YgcG
MIWTVSPLLLLLQACSTLGASPHCCCGLKPGIGPPCTTWVTAGYMAKSSTWHPHRQRRGTSHAAGRPHMRTRGLLSMPRRRFLSRLLLPAPCRVQDHVVRLLFNEQVLPLPGCDGATDCPLDLFLSVLQPAAAAGAMEEQCSTAPKAGAGAQGPHGVRQDDCSSSSSSSSGSSMGTSGGADCTSSNASSSAGGSSRSSDAAGFAGCPCAAHAAAAAASGSEMECEEEVSSTADPGASSPAPPQ